MLFNLTNITTGYVVRELYILHEFDAVRRMFTFSLKCYKRSKGSLQKVTTLENLAEVELLDVAHFLSDCLTEHQMQALIKGLDNLI